MSRLSKLSFNLGQDVSPLTSVDRVTHTVMWNETITMSDIPATKLCLQMSLTPKCMLEITVRPRNVRSLWYISDILSSAKHFYAPYILGSRDMAYMHWLFYIKYNLNMLGFRLQWQWKIEMTQGINVNANLVKCSLQHTFARHFQNQHLTFNTSFEKGNYWIFIFWAVRGYSMLLLIHTNKKLSTL